MGLLNIASDIFKNDQKLKEQSNTKSKWVINPLQFWNF